MRLRAMKDAPRDGTVILAYQSEQQPGFGNGPKWIYWKDGQWRGAEYNLPAPYPWDGWLPAHETAQGSRTK